FTFGRQRLELAKGHRKVQVGFALLQVLPQGRRLADHVHGLREHDPSLVALRGDAVDLSAALAVADQHVQPDAGQECRLAVLPADQQNEFSTPPIARLLVNKAEHRLEHGLLPEIQPHGLTDPLAFGMTAETLDELNRRRRPLQIENPRITWIAEFVDDLLILLAHPLRDSHFAIFDFLPVLKDVVFHGAPAPQRIRFFTNSISSSAPLSAPLLSGKRSISCLMTAE